MGTKLACIGGRAAYELVRQGVFVAQRIGPRPTPFGPSQPLYQCRCPGGEYLLVCRHGEAGYEVTPSLVNYRANIYALKDLEVDAVVSWSETRAISHNYRVGEYVLVDDLIDETVARPRTFFDNKELAHIRHWPVFSGALRKAFAAALQEEGFEFSDRGIYVCTEGPRQETPAEARKYETFGGQLIGQTLAPEVFLAKELQMNYASLCFVARYAETGTPYLAFESGRVLSEATLTERANRAVQAIPRVLNRLYEVLKRPVAASESVVAVKTQNGERNGNWRTWFEHPDVCIPVAANRP